MRAHRFPRRYLRAETESCSFERWIESAVGSFEAKFRLILERGDRNRDGKRQSDEERRIARVISGAVVVAMVIPAMPITAAVATM
jgi:hypothetical protein